MRGFREGTGDSCVCTYWSRLTHCSAPPSPTLPAPPQHGLWRTVIVDDRLPVMADGSFAFCHATDRGLGAGRRGWEDSKVWRDIYLSFFQNNERIEVKHRFKRVVFFAKRIFMILHSVRETHVK